MGSEMCIRDSLPVADVERFPDRDDVVCGLNVRAGHEGPGQGEPCLLYTSDAADERSSVDLGGRRIIKKKNIDRRRRSESDNH